MKFEFKANATFYADDLDDALTKLAHHFLSISVLGESSFSSLWELDSDIILRRVREKTLLDPDHDHHATQSRAPD